MIMLIDYNDVELHVNPKHVIYIKKNEIRPQDDRPYTATIYLTNGGTITFDGTTETEISRVIALFSD